MAKKQTVGQKKEARDQATAQARKEAKSGGDRIDKIIKEVKAISGGQARIYRGSNIEQTVWKRRSSGIPSIDYITNGGYPKGGLIEFGGEYSTCKTTITLHACAHEQRTTKGAVAWIALEPFSKRWAREKGFFIPFSEELALDMETGEMVPLDSFANASELELFRMEQAGITDPYEEVSPFVLVQEERGDVALDMALKLIESNQFAIVVVDSLGVAKSTKWVEEGDVQSSDDFDRGPKMIGNYTARCLLLLNARYDENGDKCIDGDQRNETTVIHLNQITTAIGTQARAAHKVQTIKGGEGNKHNHHCIIFLSKGEELRVDVPGRGSVMYGREIRAIGLKSKLGPEQRKGSFDFYFNAFESFMPGDFDVVKDLIAHAIIAGVISQSGAWFDYEGERWQGRTKVEEFFRENIEWFEHLRDATIRKLKA
jgi:RecA/RadA recombinase